MNTPRIAVLVSAGRHPASGRPRRAECDARAVELALRIAPAERIDLLHAGSDDPALRDYLGMGVGRLVVLAPPPDSDPVPALSGWLKRRGIDLVLAGTHGEGAPGMGLLPYRLAHSLGMPIVANAASLRLEGNRAEVMRARPEGLQRLALPFPAMITVGAAGPAPRQSAFGRARRGIVDVPAVPPEDVAPYTLEGELRPARPRPLANPANVSRSGRSVHLPASPQEAADTIRAFVAARGLTGR